MLDDLLNCASFRGIICNEPSTEHLISAMRFSSHHQEGLRGGSLPADFFFEEYGVMFRLATLFERTGAAGDTRRGSRRGEKVNF